MLVVGFRLGSVDIYSLGLSDVRFFLFVSFVDLSFVGVGMNVCVLDQTQ